VNRRHAAPFFVGTVRRRFKRAIGWARDVYSQERAGTQMITEIALIDVKPGTEKDFEAAVAKARPLFLRAKGGKGFELHKSIEKPSRYRLMAKWDTLENHTVDFRGSEDFAAWRGLVGQYFAAPPEVEHTETVLTSAG
jgi:heme-degrading monooxygenase HmoA